MSTPASPTNKHKYKDIHLTFGLLPEDVLREIQSYLPVERERFYNPPVVKEWLKYRNRVLNEINCVGGKGFISMPTTFSPTVIINPIGHITKTSYNNWITLFAISVISSNTINRHGFPANYTFDRRGLHPSKRHYFWGDTVSKRAGQFTSRSIHDIAGSIKDCVLNRKCRAWRPTRSSFPWANREQERKWWERRSRSFI